MKGDRGGSALVWSHHGDELFYLGCTGHGVWRLNALAEPPK